MARAAELLPATPPGATRVVEFHREFFQLLGLLLRPDIAASLVTLTTYPDVLQRCPLRVEDPSPRPRPPPGGGPPNVHFRPL